jgi:hypothetical protein
MRILIIQEAGRHEANKEFREALCFKRGFKRLGMDSEVAGLNYPKTREFEEAGSWENYANRFDAVLLLENYDQTGWVPDLSKVTALKMFWSIDSHCNINEHIRTTQTQKIDILLGAIESDLHRFPVERKFYLPNAYDDEMIYKMPGINKVTNIGFCGNGGAPDRVQYIRMLEQNAGLKFDNFVIGKDMVEAINSYKIHFNRNLKNDVNYRTFETLGCETLLFTNNTENLQKMFEIDKHLVTYDHPQDLLEKYHYYINTPDHADAIRKAGYKHVLENHTYKHRAEQICNILRNHI